MRTLSCFLIALIICCPPSTLIAQAEGKASEWELVSTSENVALYRRLRAGASHYEFKAIGDITAPTRIVHAVIDDVEAYPQFMPYTIESRALKREGDILIGYQRISTPLTKDRDYTLRVRTTARPGKEGMIYVSRWETENALGPPERPGVVRVNLCEGGWLLEPVGANATRATYNVYTDSGGAIPAFVKNIGSQIGIRRIFTAIRKQIQAPKYRSNGNRE